MKPVKYITLFALLAMVGCAGMQTLPSICDTIEPSESVLCSIAERSGVRLEDMGTVLILANMVAIKEGLYTKADAIDVLSELHALLDKGALSYVMYRKEIYKYIADYPGLISVAEEYLSQFAGYYQFIYTKDRDILRGWIDKRIAELDF